MKEQELQFLFITALTDAFKDEDDRELYAMPKVSLEDANGNDLVLAMLHAFRFVINTFADQHLDPLEFIGVLTKLLFQKEQEKFASVNEENKNETDRS